MAGDRAPITPAFADAGAAGCMGASGAPTAALGGAGMGTGSGAAAGSGEVTGARAASGCIGAAAGARSDVLDAERPAAGARAVMGGELGAKAFAAGASALAVSIRLAHAKIALQETDPSCCLSKNGRIAPH